MWNAANEASPTSPVESEHRADKPGLLLPSTQQRVEVGAFVPDQIWLTECLAPEFVPLQRHEPNLAASAFNAPTAADAQRFMEDHRASGMVLLLARSRIARLPISSGPEAPAEPARGHANRTRQRRHRGEARRPARELPRTTRQAPMRSSGSAPGPALPPPCDLPPGQTG